VNAPVIYWFRQDLRLRDLRALAAALATGRPVLCCFILDDESPGQWRAGGASRWWLHHSLAALAADIAACGGALHLARGRPQAVLPRLAERSGADHVYCSRQYEPWARQLEEDAHGALRDHGITLKRDGGALLWEPESVKNQSGAPFRVFTPFWRRCRDLPVAVEDDVTARLATWPSRCGASERLADWALLPTRPNWASAFDGQWQPGEAGARRRLEAFLDAALRDYAEGRDVPGRSATSRLSAHLHFGEIAPARVFAAVRAWARAHPDHQVQADKFLTELGWREFCHHLLFHFPSLPERAFKADFEAFPWVGDPAMLRAWQRGMTGYPLVDAGMRELWRTGYMHNRVRMVAASFLCKHLMVDWRAGQRWFWDTLVDADLANNACSWQWVAGSGSDAAPYFRIFNPSMQGRRFDARGDYIRHWLPELAALPDRHLHEPWNAPPQVLRAAGVSLPGSYPLPIVDHADARQAALAAYADLRSR